MEVFLKTKCNEINAFNSNNWIYFVNIFPKNEIFAESKLINVI